MDAPTSLTGDQRAARDAVEQELEADAALRPTAPSVLMIQDSVLEAREVEALLSGLGAALLLGCTTLLTVTAAPGRSLNTPEVTTSSPDLTPVRTAT